MLAQWLRAGAVVAIVAVCGCGGGSKSQSTRGEPIPSFDSTRPTSDGNWYEKLFESKDKVPSRKSTTPTPSAIPDPFFPNTPPEPPRQPPSAAGLSLDIQAPSSAEADKEIVVRIAIRNEGLTASPAFTVRLPIPPIVQLIRSEPPAKLNGNQLVWDLPPVSLGEGQSVTAVFRPAKPGPVDLRAEAVHDGKVLASAQASVQTGGIRTSASAGVRPAPAQLGLQVRGPTEARLGDVVTYDVSLSNPGQAAIGRVLLVAELDQGLEHESGARRLEIPIPMMRAGDHKSVQLPLTVRNPGRLRTVITTSADDGGSAREERLLDVQAATLELKFDGPSRVLLGQPATWTLRASNHSAATADGVMLRLQLPPELAYRGSSQGGQLDRGQLVWSIGRLGPRDERTVQFTAAGNRLVDRSALVAAVIADHVPEVRSDLAMEILGTPMLKVSLHGSEESVEVGGRIIYTVELRNPGSLALRDVDVSAALPPQLRPMFGAGPTIVRVEGQRIVCGRISELPAGQGLTMRFEAEAVSAGDARISVEAKSALLAAPVAQEEATRVVGQRTSGS